MNKYLQIALGLAALTVAGSSCFVAWHLSRALDAWGAGGSQTFAGLNSTLQRLNGPHGTLTMADEDLGALKSTIVHLDLVARHEQQQLVTYDGYAAQLVSHLNGTLDAAQRAAGSVSGTAQAATVAMGTANDTVRDLQPLERSLTATADASTATINTFNGRLSDPRIDDLIVHLDSTAQHGDGISASLDKMGVHLEKQVDAPITWKTRIMNSGMDLGKLAIWYFTK